MGRPENRKSRVAKRKEKGTAGRDERKIGNSTISAETGLGGSSGNGGNGACENEGVCFATQSVCPPAGQSDSFFMKNMSCCLNGGRNYALILPPDLTSELI